MDTVSEVPPVWADDISEVLIGAKDIAKRVEELGTTIAKHYAGLNPVLVIVLKGSYMFASDLSRAMPIPHELEFIRARSYEGTESSGKVNVQGMDVVDLKGKHVIIIEDIVDTGLTLTRLYECFEGAGAASVKVCSLLEKETSRRRESVPNIDYIAFHIPDKFVIGYGLDFDQRFRHLPFVGVFKQK